MWAVVKSRARTLTGAPDAEDQSASPPPQYDRDEIEMTANPVHNQNRV